MKVDAADLVNGMHSPAERHWRRLDGSERLAQVTEGVRFRDGEPLQEAGEGAVPRPQAALRLPHELANPGRHALELGQLRRPNLRWMPAYTVARGHHAAS